MKLLIQQSFPLGRFHATPWKAFPYDDPHGEWPPSPWRMLRACFSRTFQLARESGLDGAQLCEGLVKAFRSSTVSWFLPAQGSRGPNLRQYQPADFGFTNPRPAKLKLIPIPPKLQAQFSGSFVALIAKPKGSTQDYEDVEQFSKTYQSLGIIQVRDKAIIKAVKDFSKDNPACKELERHPPDFKTYNTTKVQDNFWLTPPDAALTWIIEGSDWTPELAQLLASCLDRMTYFGRAESVTEARLITATNDDLVPNCVLTDRRSNSAVPVLCWSPDVTVEQALLTSDEAKTNPPPGAVWRYADRPQRTPIKPKAVTIHRPRLPMHFIQFAVGSHVAPRYADAVRITERFRTRMLGRFVERLSGKRTKGNAWANATPEIKAQGVLLSGKQADGTPLEGHRHPYIFLHGEIERPTRLCVWRAEPFTDDEQAAILSAASHPLELSYKNDQWTITLVPLDQMVPRPSGFDQRATTRWQTVTPWVPPCHALDKKGRPKPGQSLEEQLQRDLSQHAISLAEPAVIERAGWVKSHQPTSSRRDSGPTNTSKLGYNVSLSLTAPYQGPLILGHSSHFGLGLFVPAP